MKTTATRSKSERLNASRNKNADDKEAEKKQKLLFQCYVSLATCGQRKKNSQRVFLDTCSGHKYCSKNGTIKTLITTAVQYIKKEKGDERFLPNVEATL